MSTIESYFPFSEIRDSQRDVLKALEEAYSSSDFKYFIIDAETGVGKSAAGIAAARFINSRFNAAKSEKVPGAYILTTQKILQDQYTRDFSATCGLRGIRSSSNYKCKRSRQLDCGEVARQLSSMGDAQDKLSMCKHDCVYKQAKEKFIASDLGVTNYSYWLAETTYARKLLPKCTLVLDEAHNLVGELSKFIEINVTERFSKSILKLEFPGKLTQKGAVKWIQQEYLPTAKSRLKKLQSDVKKLIGSKNNLQQFEKIAQQFDLLDKHICKVERFIDNYEESNWSYTFVPAEAQKLSKFEFKPIDVSEFAQSMVFDRADKVIFMSATILSKTNFCQLLGLKEEEVGYIKVESPFPIENRPVAYSGVGKMTASEIDKTLPKLAQAVQAILEGHPNEKGIIHAHSYKIANYIARNVKSKRLLTHESHDRDQVLQKHEKSKSPTVLVSPSMQEGVDLKGDLSRFQIICKVPYPYLGDKVVKKRMNKWKWWYDYETLKTVVQSIGRSIRSKDDQAVTYILDSGWERFASKNKKMLPTNLRATLK
jgi:Rad3-related DNA helicase